MTLRFAALLDRTSAPLAAVCAAILALAGPGISPAAAQYNDGGYASDQRGGYSDQDDEDGYEDGQDAPDVSYFHDELEDEGSWIDDEEYGQVWSPRGVDRDWRPYTRGTWANTEEHGWYWVSDEPFGWATYHYGRWHLSERRGWVWVPGTRWGPAWVAWRSNDDNIGWAPLPPESRWEHGSGLSIGVSIYESPSYEPYWSFVETRYITAPRLYTYCAPRARVSTIIYSTRPQTNYVFVNRRIVNRGVSVTTIERITRTRITTVRVNATDNRAYRTVRRDDRTINVFRPKLTHYSAIDKRAGRPAIDRNTFRDVDRRPAPRAVDRQPSTGNKAIDDLARQQAAPSRQDDPNDRTRAITGLPPYKETGRNRNRALNRNVERPNAAPAIDKVIRQDSVANPDPGRNVDQNAALNRERAIDRNRAVRANREREQLKRTNPYAQVQGRNPANQPFSGNTFNAPPKGDPKAQARAANEKKRRANQKDEE